MAIVPKHYWVSPGQFYDADSSDYIHLIVGQGAPDGDADPQLNAAMGSLYFRDNASDDQPCLYVKVDSDGADDDWVAVLVDYDEAAKQIEAFWTWATSNGIYLRDTSMKLYSSAASTAYMALTSPSVFRIGSTASYVQFDANGLHEPQKAFILYDDFLYAVIDETTTSWILNEGTDGAAADPAISVQEGGVVQLVTGAGDGSTAEDASQIVAHIPVQADSGGLVFETRLHINTAITNVSVFAGLTDSTAREEPFTNAADVLTSTATDAVGWLYDTSATTDEWWLVAVDGDADDAGCAAVGTAPVADTYQRLRFEVSADGATIKGYINDVLELTLTGDTGVSPDVNLYATVIACGDGTLSKSVDVDYIYVGHTR